MPAARIPLVALLTLGLALPAVATGDAPVWRYQYGSTSVVWSHQDLQVLPAKAATPSLSLRDQFVAKFQGDPDFREVESRYQVVSAVGPLLSLEKFFYADGGGSHPTLLTTFEALDVRRPRQPALLTDYFPDRDVLAAMLNDRLVKEALATLPPAPPPRTSKQLLSRLAKAETGCEYAFQDDFLSAFVFHHLVGDKVAVRLGLTYGGEPCRGQLTQLGLLLPIPAALKQDFRAAQARRAGFLARQATEVHHGATTKLRYDPDPRP